MPDPLDDPAMMIALLPTDALDGVEGDVLVTIDRRRREAAAARRMGMWLVVAALTIGLVGGGLAGGAASARAAGPVGIDAMLAPSTLLLGR